MALTETGGGGLQVGSGLIWGSRSAPTVQMTTVFEKKGRGALGLLLLCSMPEVMPEVLVKRR